MSRQSMRRLMFLVVVLSSLATVCRAAPPWEAFLFMKSVPADPNQSYAITEEQGPWLILACSFSGKGAEKQARELVYELRKRYGLTAYTYRGHFDFGKAVGLHSDKFGKPLPAKYLKQQKNHLEIEEIAVMVGDFSSVDDSQAQKTLQKIKDARPECLQIDNRKSTNQSLSYWRQIEKQMYEAMTGKKKEAGPMSHAFITTNPLLPPEYFVADQGINEDILALNKDVPYSLLECPGRYTVQVATFKGRVIIKQDEIRDIQAGREKFDSKLARAAENADRLTRALREKGYEAYQFHDRSASIVTIGSFNSVGTPRPDGRIEINPQIHKIMKCFAAEAITQPGQATPVTKLQTLMGIPFDVQPIPVEVPKRSISVALRRQPQY